MTSLRFSAETVDIKALIDGKLSPKAQARAFGKWCQQQTDHYDAINQDRAGIVLAKVLTIDDDVVPKFVSVPVTSVAEVNWPSDFAVVSTIWQMVHDLSPVRKGTYKASHVLLADGNEVAGPDPSLHADEWTIISTVVYARKIDGINLKKKFESQQAPNGVYQIAAVKAQDMFQNVSINFTLVQLYSGGLASKVSLIRWAAKRNGVKSRGGADAPTRKQHRQFQKDARNPAIIIRFK